MSAGGPVEEPGSGRLAPARLLAFSDGVVAIALTLLVLPLADLVPDRAEPGVSAGSLVTDNLPLVGSFLLSFATIGRFWMAHHRLFDRVRHTTRALVWANLAWLLTIVVLPFPTEMVGVFRDDPFTLRFYVGALFANSLMLSVIAVVVARTGVVGPGRQPGALTPTALLAVAFVVVLVWPGAGYLPLLLLFLDPVVSPLVARARIRLLGQAGDDG